MPGLLNLSVRLRHTRLRVPESPLRLLLTSSSTLTHKQVLSSPDPLTWPTLSPCSPCSPWLDLGSTSSPWLTHHLSTVTTQATLTSPCLSTGSSSSSSSLATRCPAPPDRLVTPTLALRPWATTLFLPPPTWLLPHHCRPEAQTCLLRPPPLPAASPHPLTSHSRLVSNRVLAHQASALLPATLTTRLRTRSATP